jgi:light-regulated signal transduction histidine kinase (bacteriophytochrome)
MGSPSKPVPDPLAEALEENQQLRSSLARLQTAYESCQEKTKQQTAAANEQLQQFLYAASHDLQEPLRGIITYAQLLDREFAADPVNADSANRESTSFILSSALRMRELLQQMLVYSRAGSAKHRKAVNLNVPLQMALLKLAPEIAACGAQIVHDPLPEVFGDETEIAQVFEHIMSNSLKFRSASPPEIVISAEQGTEQCTVTVRDNGIGIDPRFCEQVLLPFKRLHGNGIPGAGLGLAICNKILSANQGHIQLESDGEHGSTVRFSLPV